MEKYVDPLVEEVRERGRKFTARYGHDPSRVMDELRKYSNAHAEQVVDQIRVVRTSESTGTQP